MSAEGFRQEMPPKGGFAGITWERIPLKKPWGGMKVFGLYFIISGACFKVYSECIRNRRKLRRENEELTVALEPLLVAERDRMFLAQLHKNRQEEADLMKNVPGWKVGTWMGEPIYKTSGDKLIDPFIGEYYAHCDPKISDYYNTYDFWM